jgi:hypothetical protein
VSEYAIKPYIYKEKYTSISCAFDIVDPLALMIIMMCWGYRTIEVVDIPVFQPNEYLFETHKDKGEERWEIYAWALRDAMSKASGVPTSDQSMREKIRLEEIINNEVGFKTSLL